MLCTCLCSGQHKNLGPQLGTRCLSRSPSLPGASRRLSLPVPSSSAHHCLGLQVVFWDSPWRSEPSAGRVRISDKELPRGLW